MIREIYTAGMLARMKQLEIAANNLANLNTVGFKKDDLDFRQLIADDMASTGGNGLAGSEEFRTDFTQGGLSETTNRFDLALDGPGFFTVQVGADLFYTRNGNFSLNENGELVTALGYQVHGTSGPITITSNDAKINSAGEIIVNNSVAGKLRIVDFPDKTQLTKQGDNLFAAPPALQPGQSSAIVRQGFLEESNVDPLQLMVELIDLQSAFETSQRVLRAEDDTLRRSVNDLGKY
jgi:flagellar basal-body rod protein FlgG